MDKKYCKVEISDQTDPLELDIMSGNLGPDVIDISNLYQENSLFTYDPGFVSTASCQSNITFIDGDKGLLLYRGYPVEELAKSSTFIEVAYLLLYGELPNKTMLEDFSDSITQHTMLNEGMLRLFNGFRYDAHPMAMVSAIVGSMSAYYHDTMDINSARAREIFAHRIIAKIPTIATI